MMQDTIFHPRITLCNAGLKVRSVRRIRLLTRIALPGNRPLYDRISVIDAISDIYNNGIPLHLNWEMSAIAASRYQKTNQNKWEHPCCHLSEPIIN